MPKAARWRPTAAAKAFDARADGYVRGEGAACRAAEAAVRRARADGDSGAALVRGSARQPRRALERAHRAQSDAQEAVLRDAHAVPRRSGAGRLRRGARTGTTLGDPIEAAALGAVLARRAILRGR
jgi:acyl transferase domain-containing protein